MAALVVLGALAAGCRSDRQIRAASPAPGGPDGVDTATQPGRAAVVGHLDKEPVADHRVADLEGAAAPVRR